MKDIKKLLFLGILSVCIFFIFSCKFFGTDETENNVSSSNVVYSPDGKITIYFDENRASVRALTLKQAVMGHDFFEAVFLYNTGSGYITARANWRVGQKAGISGVYRTTPGGVNYGSVSSNPSIGSGSAVLFAGKYSDKTLLAVGSICAVDDIPVTPSRPAIITTTTKSVSFELNALKAGAKAEPSGADWTAVGSSFFTNSRGGSVSEASTEVRSVTIAYRNFPLYRLDVNQTVSASYTISLNASGVNGNGVTIPAFDNYGIVLAGTSGVRQIKPKYTLNTNVYESKAFPYDAITALNLNNNLTQGQQFQNPVLFTFNTTGTADGSIFAFIFEISVFALSSSGENPVMWVIRPGYDEYLEELDDGNGGSGGAILIGTGNVNQFITYGLHVDRLPNKIQYNTNTGYTFDIAGLLVNLVTGEGGFVRVINTTSNNNYDPNLKFYYDNIQILPGASFPPMNRYLMIHMTYDDTATGGTYSGSFLLNLSTIGTNFSDIPEENRFLIANPWEVQGAFNNMGSGGTFLLVFSSSMDITANIANTTAPLTVIFAVNRPRIVLGRAGETSQIVFNGNQNTLIYFGGWLFNEPIFIAGNILTDEPFAINAGGSNTVFPAPSSYNAPDATNVLVRHMDPAMLDVFVDNIVTVANDQWLKFP